MTEQRKHFPEFYVTAPQPCPYLSGRFERKLFTHLTHDKAPALVDNLLKGGFRRSQNIAYMPYCEGCQACVSVRVRVNDFEPTRSMRRVMDINSDIVARRLQATPTSEQYSLFRAYIDARHADGGMADMSVLDYAMMVEDSIIDTFMTEYRLAPDPRAKTPADKRPLMGGPCRALRARRGWTRRGRRPRGPGCGPPTRRRRGRRSRWGLRRHPGRRTSAAGGLALHKNRVVRTVDAASGWV